LYTADGRHFKQAVQFTLKVNTPPPAITHYAVAKTKPDNPGEDAYYVLCLQVPDMDVPVTGGLLHKDIVGIEINGTTYPLSVNEEQHTFITPKDTAFLDITDVEKLDESDAEELPSGWVLYFKTDAAVKAGSPKKEYTVRLKDAKGLYSKSVTAMTQLNEPQQAQAAVITGTKIDSLSGDGTAQEQAIVIKAAASAPEAQIKLSVPDKDVTIHYTLTEAGLAPTPEQTGTPSVTVALPLNGAGEKVYTLTYRTDGVAFKPSASKTVYYKVLKEHTVTFDSKGGSAVPAQKILHGSKILEPAVPTAPSGHSFRNWCKDEAGTIEWNFAADTVTGDMTLYAKWTANRYTVQFNGNGNIGGTMSDQLFTYGIPQALQLNNFTRTGHTFKGWANESTATEPSYTDGQTVQDLTAEKDATVTLYAVWELDSTIVINGDEPGAKWKELKDAIGKASDGDTILIRGTIQATFGGAGNNKNYEQIEIKHNITIKGTNRETDILDANQSGATNEKKHRIFEVASGKKLTLENLTLTNGKVLNGKSGGAVFINSGAEVTLNTVKLANNEASELSGKGGAVYNEGILTINENTVITGNKAHYGGGIYNTGTLTVNDSTFTTNATVGAKSHGGAIYSEGGRLTLKGCSIGGDSSDVGNTAKKGGGIYLKNVLLTMQSAVNIKHNEAATQGGGIYLEDGNLDIPAGNTIAGNSITAIGNSQAGGGIYVAKGNLRLSGGSISGNSAAANKGGGVYLKTGTFIMTAGEIKNCSAKFGGGVGLAGTSSFTMTGGSITGCHADVDDGQGGGIYTELNTTLTLQGENADNPVVISDCTAKKTGGGMHIYTNNGVTIENANIEENAADNGGGLYLEKGELTIAGSTRITPSPESNDVYLAGTSPNNAMITVNDALTGTDPVARITPKEYPSGNTPVQVLTGTEVGTEHTKFTVTPQDLGSGNTQEWEVDNNGKLQKKTP